MDGITFFIEAMGRPAYAGAVRPFLGWASELEKAGRECEVVTLKADAKFCGELERMKVPHSNFDDIASAARHVGSSRPGIIISDDSPENLARTSELRKRTGIRTGTYVQLLMGTHSIGSGYDLGKAPLGVRAGNALMKAVPFIFFRKAYQRLAGRKDEILICNSKSSADMLQILYGMEPYGIVYPPVDREVFNPGPSPHAKKRQAMLYLGSYGWDTDRALAAEAARRLADGGVKVLAFGNKGLMDASGGAGIGKFAEHIGHCTDSELAGHYSESSLTVCLQKWELFGYVAAESVCCGTPVIAFNCMGYGEIADQTGFGVLADNRRELLECLGDLDRTLARIRRPQGPKAQNEPFQFGRKQSTDRLLEILRGAMPGRF